ncbi:hypothetical protein CMK22_08255 [Candidatus Poribacteria bacterium]|nr:hypothetical protein [Candidatus Poribacteria bacterium]
MSLNVTNETDESLVHTPRFASDVVRWLLIILGCLTVGFLLGVTSESPLMILVVLVVIGVFVFLGMDLAFYSILLFLPFSFRYIIPGRGFEVQTPSEPLLGMLVAVFLIQQIFDRVVFKTAVSEDRKFPFASALTLFIIITILSAINSPDMSGSIKGAIRANVYVMSSFLTFFLIRSRQNLQWLFWSVFPTAIVAVVWTVIVLVYNIDLWQWTSAYRGSPFTNYSVFGSYTAVFFLIVLSRLLLDRSPYDRVFWSVMLVIFTVGIFLCFSRGVWLSLIISVGFLLINLPHAEQHKRILIVSSSFVLLLVLLLLPSVSDLISERISTLFDPQFASNRSRLLRWGQAFLMFLEHPIIGNGYGAFAMLYQEDASLTGEYVAQFQLGAHSEYMQILAEQGSLGIFAWFWLILIFFRFGLQALRRVKETFFRSLVLGIMAVELSFFVHFFVNNLLNGDAIGIPFWVLYGLLPAVVGIAEREFEAA